MSGWHRWQGGSTRPRPEHASGQPWSRRAVLTSAVAAVTLPWLPSLAPRSLRAQASGAPVRLLWWYVPNGFRQPSLLPTAPDAWTPTPLLAELGPRMDDVLLVRGLSQVGLPDSPSFPHPMGTAAFLTGVEVAGGAVRAGVSVDQVAAAAHAGRTPIPSLHLVAEAKTDVGQCESNYGCAYYRAISWSTPTTPAGRFSSPRAVFDHLFGPLAHAFSPEERALRTRLHLSVLDGTRDELNALRARVSPEERHRVDEHLTALREVELRVDADDRSACEMPPFPDDPVDPTARIDLLTDLTVTALRCDLTRYVTFMMGEGGSVRSFGFLGFPGTHHSYAHHQNLPENLAALEAINRWEMARYRYLLDRLATAPDGDGTLLDACLAAIGSECDDGADHGMRELAMMVGGRGGGQVQPGRSLDAGGRSPRDLWAAMLQAAGISNGVVGDATGPLLGVLS